LLEHWSVDIIANFPYLFKNSKNLNFYPNPSTINPLISADKFIQFHVNGQSFMSMDKSYIEIR